MAENGTMNLSLKIAGFDDFYPYELTLEEGFSQVYKAELTVFTKTRREQKALRELLDRNVSLAVSQRIAGGLVTRSRYLHGIITGIADTGAAGRGDTGTGASCYRHVITIESELARLRHTRLSAPYYRKTPPDIIEEILAKYGIQGRFSADCLDRGGYCKNLMFDQTGSPDLVFLNHIMSLYGISWVFTHGKAAPNGLGTAELHFTEGGRFPPPFYEYSDKRKVPDIETFDFLNYDDRRNIWKMDGWHTRSSTGVDGLEITAPYPEAGYGSRDWRWGETGPGKRCYRYGSLFHGYARGTAQGEIDADIKSIIEARRIGALSARETLTGRAENLMLMPGLIFTLGHFHGPGDAEALTALVTNAKLHVRALWPGDLAAPPPGYVYLEETGEFAGVEFSAADWGKDSEKRFCGGEMM